MVFVCYHSALAAARREEEVAEGYAQGESRRVTIMELSSDDLLMECFEDEDPYDEDTANCPENGQPTAGLQIIPIPFPPIDGCSPSKDKIIQSNTLESSGARLGFMVNGRRVPLPPGGGSTQMKLNCHPSGSSSGFTTVQIPTTQTRHSSTRTPSINTIASLTTCVASVPPLPQSDPTPIITGVVSGEAAERVLKYHSAKPATQAPCTMSSPPQTRPAQYKLPLKGQLSPVLPPKCNKCMTQYKEIPELRGFMCLCSPAIAQSLTNLKIQKKRWLRRINDRRRRRKEIDKDLRTSNNHVTLDKTSHHMLSTDSVASDQLPGLSSPNSQNASESQPGKLVIMAEDFYYGSVPGQISEEPVTNGRKNPGPYRCIQCLQVLLNNMEMMLHVHEHGLSDLDTSVEAELTCPQCFRHFSSPSKMQSHQETVHGQTESTVTCKICELAFGDESNFLKHMMKTHKPGEMPYACQVCNFRTSFYSDLRSHFEEAHTDTKHILCQYCLRVLVSSSCYQQHVIKHQKKKRFECSQCRLSFINHADRGEHKQLHHKTYIKPFQLVGLKPGTKVTVRTYSATEDTDQSKTVSPSKVGDVDGAPPRQQVQRTKPVWGFGPSNDGLAEVVSHPLERCFECKMRVQNFPLHFPLMVNCSRCSFTTCCPRAYANHMINKHASVKKTDHYPTMLKPRPLPPLKCRSCPFTTRQGDRMAIHLIQKPRHACVVSRYTAAKEDRPAPPVPKKCGFFSHFAQVWHRRRNGMSAKHPGKGFIPIDISASCQISPNLWVKPLHSPPTLPSPPAMTVKFLKNSPNRPPPSPLPESQLSVLLFSLCSGIPQAMTRFQTSALLIWSWMLQWERKMGCVKWAWQTDSLAEWVLRRREQQLQVSDKALLQVAEQVLGKGSEPVLCYNWAVEFMLRHHLGPQPTSRPRHLLKSVCDGSQAFICSLCSKIQTKCLLPRSVGFMDELAVFVDPEQFSTQSLSALKLFGSPEETPLLDVVLSALCDGTFLRPLLFFKGPQPRIPEGFPKNVLLEARPDGFTDRERLRIWNRKVWSPAVSRHGPSLLMADVYRGHRTELEDCLSTASTDVAFIPAGCCCRLQPLDVCVTPVIVEFLQVQWKQLVTQGALEGLGVDQLALTMACWLSEVSSALNADRKILRRSFATVCHLQQAEDQVERTEMTRTLAELLIQPLEPFVHPTEEQLLLLVQSQGEAKEQVQEQDSDSDSDPEEKEQQLEQQLELKKELKQEQDEDQDQNGGVLNWLLYSSDEKYNPDLSERG